jgi:uncharacterized protein (TIGR03435 family)
MTCKIIGAVMVSFFGATTYGHTADPARTFEVASIKALPPADPEGTHACLGGPGTSNPGIYRCLRMTVSSLAFQAYGLKAYQVEPGFHSDTAEYEIAAKVPPGTTQPMVKVMMQNLLAERFKLKFHYEPKQMQV